MNRRTAKIIALEYCSKLIGGEIKTIDKCVSKFNQFDQKLIYSECRLIGNRLMARSRKMKAKDRENYIQEQRSRKNERF